ncbi:hypothetical protein LCGC14_0950060 [marine sediment metagenome]|uniref:Uncharacterized protein n=1 Tax=marine sediment metagenome TaxID=412755 RepID=A0A0F9NMB5_9ZZZZ
MSRRITEDIELHNKSLIKQCVFGEPFSLKTTSACEELALRCNTNMKNSTFQEREGLRRQVIDDVNFINRESKLEDKEALDSGEQYYKVYSDPNIFDEGFDEKSYIDNKTEDKLFGICSLSLYGLEKQFFTQVNDSFFQSRANSDALKNTEAIIFDEDVKIVEKPIISELELDFAWEKFKGASFFDYLMLSNFGDQDTQSFSDDLDDYRRVPYQIDKLKDILIGRGFLHPKKYKKVPQASSDIYQKKYEICNLVTNPKVEQGRYKICSDADLKGKQAFFFKIRKRPTQPSIIDYTTGEKVVLDRGGNWVKGSRLDCWHNFLAYVEYPEIIKNRWMEVLLAYENKDITKEQYDNAINDIKKMEELFQIDMREGNAKHGFTKPTTYQPLRLRLYGSQKSVNDLVNKFLRFNPLNDDTVPNNPTRSTVENAFTPMEIYQLRENRIITPEFIEEQLEELNEMSLDDVWEKAEDGIRESEVESELDNWGEIWEEDQIYDNKTEFTEIEEALFGTEELEAWDSDIEVYHQLGEPAYKSHLERNVNKPIIVREGDFLWQREEQTSDFIDNYDWLFSDIFPTVPLPIIKQKLKSLTDLAKKSYWVWEGREDFIAYIPYKKFIDRIEEGVVAEAEELEYRYYESDTPNEKLGVLEEFPKILQVIEAGNKILRDNDYDDYFEYKDYIAKPITEKLKELKLLKKD